jgi:hypothetical protein
MKKLLLVYMMTVLAAGIAMAQGDPLAGSYDIAGGNSDYTTLGAATADLMAYGVSGSVVFNMYPDTLYEPLELGSILGASGEHTVTFRSAPSYFCTIVSDTTPNVHLTGTDYVVLHDFGVHASVTAGECIRVEDDADNNVMSNLQLCGMGYASNAYGLRITGGGNDSNIVDAVTVDSCYTGISVTGTSGSPVIGNSVRNSTVYRGVYSIRTSYQDGARIENNDVQVGFPGATSAVYGIFIGSQVAGDTVRVLANDVHNFRTNFYSYGIWVEASSLSSFTLVSNNFVYGWNDTGAAYRRGLYAYSGKSAFYFNSVRINDTPSTNNAVCCMCYNDSVYVKDNIFQVDDTNITSFGIYRYPTAEAIVSDYNCFYSTSVSFSTGYDGTAARMDLGAWQDATGLDMNSRRGNPGFLSSSNLHISSSSTFVNGVGTTIPLVDRDYDGTLRGSPPDIGADEYEAGPMHGNYDIAGGNMDYVDIPSAVSALSSRGINDAVSLFPRIRESQRPIPSFLPALVRPARRGSLSALHLLSSISTVPHTFRLMESI